MIWLLADSFNFRVDFTRFRCRSNRKLFLLFFLQFKAADFVHFFSMHVIHCCVQIFGPLWVAICQSICVAFVHFDMSKHPNIRTNANKSVDLIRKYARRIYFSSQSQSLSFVKLHMHIRSAHANLSISNKSSDIKRIHTHRNELNRTESKLVSMCK